MNTYNKKSKRKGKIKRTSRRTSKKKSKRKSKGKRKSYRVNSKKCKKFSKKKSPRCENQENCVWIIGSGCKYRKKKSNLNIFGDFIEQPTVKKETKNEHDVNKDIERMLFKHLPKNIKIKDTIKQYDLEDNNIVIKNYNIPIGKKLIKLGRKRFKVVLDKKSLQYFEKLLIHNDFEIGGKLDFNLDNVFERSTNYLGKNNSVNIKIFDYEVPYHTHPLSLLNKQFIFNTPSVGDYDNESFLGDIGVTLFETVRTNVYLQQCNIVFAPDGVYVWYFSEKAYSHFKKYKHNYNTFKLEYFKNYKEIVNRDLHSKRLVDPLSNNLWIKTLEKMGIFMFKYIHSKYTYGLNWNKRWNIKNKSTYDSLKKIQNITIPRILDKKSVYPDIVPLYIVPIEPLERLN